MVASAVLFLMVALASVATISYLRGYRHYTQEGAKLRVASKTLEAVCFELRSAQTLKQIPASLLQGPLQYENSRHEACSLELRDRQIWVQRGKEQARLGEAFDLQLEVQNESLRIQLPVTEQPPLKTSISIRGMAR